MNANKYIIRKVLGDIQAKGKLPEDDYGNVLPTNDLIGWFELKDKVTADELNIIKHELELMAQAQFILGFS